MSPKEVVAALLEIEAVQLNFKEGFQWVSGIQSPIYCDNRLLISSPKYRKQIAKAFASKIKNEFPDCEIIAGTATAGIPHAAWVADVLDLPMIYIRSKAKEHGKKSMIEGKFKKGQRAILIEDLISTGKSSVTAAVAMREEGLEVQKVYSIFNYQLKKAEKAFENSHLNFESLADVSALISYGLESSYFTESESKELNKFFTELG
jgi:orotate phosphoribosyltransferase